MNQRPKRRRLANYAGVIAGLAAIATVSAGPATEAAAYVSYEYTVSRPDYMSQFGSWQTIELPEEVRLNAIHAALLYSGKILIVAGSGNSQAMFDAKTFHTILYDPATGTSEKIETPEDLFCGGHAYLPDGNLLIAGGTRRYEILPEKIDRAAGVMTIKNENPNLDPITLPAGTVFRSSDGRAYVSTEDTTVQPATAMKHGRDTMVHASSTQVWVEAEVTGAAGVIPEGSQYTIDGLAPSQTKDVYGVADKLTMDKQEYQGLDASYIFDVQAEKYVPTGRLQQSRWYPTLVGMASGNVMAVSGLDQHGLILPGNNEVYELSNGTWNDKPELARYFPTYPALFLTNAGDLFYSGSNAGYGEAEKGRTPGIWHLADNSFREVKGLRDPVMTETSSSVMLPPAQDQKVMIAGGGGIGDSADVTARTDVIDLDEPEPHFTPGPDLPTGTRYLGTVVLPDDTVLLTGGSSDYRGRGDSDVLESRIYHPNSNTLSFAAPPRIGRNYHSEALLLPSGQVLTMGSDPLYGDADGTPPGKFEQRLELYTPAYLYDSKGNLRHRPEITLSESSVKRGGTLHVDIPDQEQIASARLIRPSAVTHTTDVEQRSIALDVKPSGSGLDLGVPNGEGLVPSGWYMLFVTDQEGTPSTAKWVQVQ